MTSLSSTYNLFEIKLTRNFKVQYWFRNCDSLALQYQIRIKPSCKSAHFGYRNILFGKFMSEAIGFKKR